MPATPKSQYLTELVLAIHNEIQSAVDYIAESSGQDGTELGKAPAHMAIESLRVRLPIMVELEQEESSAAASAPARPVATSAENVRAGLAARKGFRLETSKTGDRALFAKVKVRSADEAGDATEKGLGEIEIQFSPLRRP